MPAGNTSLPLSSGEVMAIDLESGKVVATAKSRRSAVPGNLVCYRGRVISQGLDGLELYYQADAAREEVARRLAANPDDVEGLTLRGEMLLDAGKSAEAVADFRRAYSLEKKSESHGRTRELLRDALLAGLHDDFAAHRSMAGEVEPLLDDAAQRATYFRCMATGLHRAGDWQQAVEYYLKLVDLEEGTRKPVGPGKIDRSYLVRRDRWVQARLGMLRSEGGAAAAAEIDRVLEQRLEEAKKDTELRRPEAVPCLLRQSTPGGGGAGGTAPAPDAGGADPGGRTAHGRGRRFHGPQGPGRLAGRHGRTRIFAPAACSDAAACFRQLQRAFADVPCHATAP